MTDGAIQIPRGDCHPIASGCDILVLCSHCAPNYGLAVASLGTLRVGTAPDWVVVAA
jgi:hypothetical protein